MRGKTNGRKFEFPSNFPCFDFRFCFPALILILGISNDCFINWIDIEVQLPANKFIIFSILGLHGDHNSRTTKTLLRSSSPPPPPSSSSSPPSSSSEINQYRRVIFIPELKSKVLGKSQSEIKIPIDTSKPANTSFGFGRGKFLIFLKSENEVKDGDESCFESKNQNQTFGNKKNDSGGGDDDGSGGGDDDRNIFIDDIFDDLNCTVELIAKRSKVTRAVLVMGRSGWMNLDHILYLSTDFLPTNLLQVPWENFRQTETETERLDITRSIVDNQLIFNINDDDNDYDVMKETKSNPRVNVTTNVTHHHHHHHHHHHRHHHHHSEDNSFLVMMMETFLLCLLESKYGDVNRSIDCVNDSMLTITIATVLSCVLVAMASIMSFSFKGNNDSHQSIKLAISAFVFGFAALFQLLSLILFIQSSSDIHFCFNDRTTLVPSTHPTPTLQITYGTGFYVAILIFLLTNMAAVAASGRRCEDVMMAFKI